MRGGRTAVALLAAVAVLPLTACGSGPTTESMCDYFYEKGEELRKPYLEADTQNKPLETLALTAGAPGDFAAFFKGLADNSPDDIRADVEAVAEAFKATADANKKAASNPFAALGGGLLAGINAAGPMSRLNQYLLDNCGPPPQQ